MAKGQPSSTPIALAREVSYGGRKYPAGTKGHVIRDVTEQGVRRVVVELRTKDGPATIQWLGADEAVKTALRYEDKP